MVAASGHDLPSRLALSQTLAQFARIADAKREAEALARQFPNDGAAWHLLGTCQAQLGDKEASLHSLRRALELHTTGQAKAWTWQAIAEGKRFAHDDADLGDITHLLDAIPATADQAEARAILLYALGKAWSDLGEHSRAFSAYEEGARLTQRLRPYNADSADKFALSQIQNWTQKFHKTLPEGLASDRPIFVLGLPRSGTTLVEQILTTHEAVGDGGEINLFSAAAMPIRGLGHDAVEAFVAHRGTEGLQAVAGSYLHLLEQWFGPVGRTVDKTLNHSRFLGLIATALPEARFVWMQRDPRAVAWSCYRTRMARGAEWSWSLQDIGRHFAMEEKLCAHWTQIFGNRILHVSYESLVQNPEKEIARLLGHLGLPDQQGLTDFHMSTRAVTTASFDQVRRPIYTTANEAWRAQADHLEPFVQTYRQFGGMSA